MENLQRLAMYFTTFIDYETLLEAFKIDLCASPSYEPYNSFREIDNTISGFITRHDISAYLQINQIKAHERHIDKVISQYSSSNNGKIFVGTFFKFILPRTRPELREQALKRKPGVLTSSLRRIFLKIIELELEMWEKIQEIKEEIHENKNFSILEAFASIDVPRTGFISNRKIKDFLKSYGKDYSDEEVDVVLKRLDTDSDNMLSFEEFSLGLSLNQPNILTENPKELKKSIKPNTKGCFSSNVYKLTTKDPLLLLLEAFELIITLENKIELEKQKLIKCPEFNLIRIFNVLDPNSLKFSTESDFFKGQQYFGVKYSKDEVILLFKQYSIKYNKRLTYNQISELFLPCLEISDCEQMDFHADTIKKVKNLLDVHYGALISLEKYRQYWDKQKISLQEVFKVFKTETVTSSSIQSLLQAHESSLNPKELGWVMKYFKKTLSETITFADFQAEFTPKSIKRY
jgi:Ca2+-binding EF-hand superfamily protein